MNNLEKLETSEIKTISEEAQTFIAFFEGLQIPETLEEITNNKKELKKAEESLKEKRKEFFENLEEEKKIIMNVEKAISNARKELDIEEKKLKQYIVDERKSNTLNFLNLNRKDTFDFITNTELMDEKMILAKNFTPKNELTKSFKETLLNIVNKLKDDELLINGDETVLSFYKKNGYNAVQAFNDVKEIREQEAKRIQEAAEAKRIQEAAEVKRIQEEQEAKRIQEAASTICDNAEDDIVNLDDVLLNEAQIQSDYEKYTQAVIAPTESITSNDVTLDEDDITSMRNFIDGLLEKKSFANYQFSRKEDDYYEMFDFNGHKKETLIKTSIELVDTDNFNLLISDFYVLFSLSAKKEEQERILRQQLAIWEENV